MKKKYLDYAGLKRVLKRLLPGARKIWHGTLAEWEALSETERDKYDQAEVIDGSGYGAKALHPRPDWANAVTISAGQIFAGYTVPDDGTLVLKVGPNYAGSRTFYIDDIEVGGYSTSNTSNMSTITLPICKGQVIKSSSRADAGPHRFVPWKA